MHLLDAGELPALRAVDRLGEIPYFLEAGGRLARRLAHGAREAHARPVLVALGHDFQQVGVQGRHIGLLLLAAARLHIFLEFFEQ